MWGVQRGRMDQDIGRPQCGQSHRTVSQVSDDARPAAGNPVHAADHPAGYVECLSQGRSDPARTSGNRNQPKGGSSRR
ncbi:hypothetical protein SALB_00883 [Streptomyces noursei]|uniref:Uncharacterized protein n=1 Tax=Streptomyces noursei TaxID=1971 RepID=A0A401QS61_STRNR|nr:hypothetical protein SALB_00883 [Streptomyces noursei]